MTSFASDKPAARMGRRQPMGLHMITAAEALQLENSVRKKNIASRMRVYAPVLLWLMWIVLGCAFYSMYNNYDISRGLYVSINIGWCMNWTLDESFGSKHFDDTIFRLVSICYIAAGTVLLGFSAIFISQTLIGNKDKWLKPTDDNDDDCSTYGTFIAYVKKALPNYNIHCMFILWFVFGVLMFWGSQPWYFTGSVDYVISTLTGAGYKAIAAESTNWQFALAALYCTIGVPLWAIAIGLGVSSFFEPSHDDLLARLLADVTDEEINFMVEFGIIDDDGKVEKSEFVVLMAVRIGKASIQLLSTINERFRELDRKKLKRIALDDIVEGRQGMSPETRKAMFANIGLNSVAMSSFVDVESELGRIAQRKVRRRMSSTGFHSFDTLQTEPQVEDVDSSNCHEKVVNTFKMNSSGDGSDSGVKSTDSSVDSENLGASAVSTNDINYNTPKHATGDNCMHLNICDGNPLGDDLVVNEIMVPVVTAAAGPSTPVQRSESSCPSLITKRGGPPLSIEVVDLQEDKESVDLEDFRDTLGELDVEELPNYSMPLRREQSSSKSLQTVIENLRGSALARHSSVQTPGFFRQPSVNGDIEMLPSLPSLRKMKLNNWSQNSDFNIQTPRPGMGMEPRFASARLGRQDSIRSLPPMSPALTRIISVNIPAMKPNSVPIYIYGVHISDLESQRLIEFYKFCIHPYTRLLCLWLIWIFCGTMFYTLYGSNSRSWQRGLYISTSVGVGMFWMVGDNELGRSPVVKIFTVVHMLLGSVAAGCFRASVAHSMAEAKGQWYVYALKKKEYLRASARADMLEYIRATINFYGPRAVIHVVLFVLIVCGVILGCAQFNFSFLDSIYFSVGALAAGGFKPTPENSKEWEYALVGVFIVLGAPIRDVSLSMLAQWLADVGKQENLDDVMHMLVTEKEIKMLAESGIENTDGHIDMSQYTVLILLRLGAISTDLIAVVNEWFDEFGDLDSECGDVTLERIKAVHIAPDTPMRKRVSTLVHV